MSSEKIREDKTCLNCGTDVEKHFCPHCGQKNVESRQSFHHLFTHFITDLLHYDSSFWRTTKYLLLYPARLSNEYMDGKRKNYVNPFTLYIFISFVAFFVMFSSSPITIINDSRASINTDAYKLTRQELANKKMGKDTILTIIQTYKTHEKKASKQKRSLSLNKADFNKALNSIDWSDPAKQEKFTHSIFNYLPKFLFFYMPIFAFWLWLFHSRKKRKYFDSGIFTLHYFSSFLLILSIYILLKKLLDWIGWSTISYILLSIVLLYTLVYFLIALRRFYRNRKFAVIWKGLLLFILNTTFILTFLVVYIVIIAYYAYW